VTPSPLTTVSQQPAAGKWRIFPSSLDSSHQLPTLLPYHSSFRDDYIFFLSKEEVPYGCFSNSYRECNGGHVGFHEAAEGKNDPRFWCINQELHYAKAVLFGDDETAQLILDEKEDANAIKQLGRQVKNYDDAKWTEIRYDVARDAVHSKFANDEALKKILLSTKNKIILEASTDKAWGIGCVEFSTDATTGAKNKETGDWDVEPNEWKGENILGRCLMDVRKSIADEA
jgi:ribA/ribD-fused uncharacterized protein